MVETWFNRRSIRVRPWILAAFLIAWIIPFGCAQSRQDFALAESAVDLFHSQLDSEKYSAIYRSSDSKMQQSISESDFVNFLEGVHRKFGTFQSSSERSKVFVFHDAQTATIMLDYNTKFAQGSGTERFKWQIRDNRAILDSYKIDSSELVTKQVK